MTDEGPGGSGANGLSKLSVASAAHDHTLVERARSFWLSGDWENISRLDVAAIEGHPDRGKLALIVASAWQHLNDHDAARRFVRLAVEWGCDRKLIARVLVANVHNTLAIAAALSSDQSAAFAHFRAAVSGAGGSISFSSNQRATNELRRVGLSMAVESNGRVAIKEDSRGAHRARAVRELTERGALSDAAVLLGHEVEAVAAEETLSDAQAARLRMLEVELQILHHELSLAQQRHQLDPKTAHARGADPIAHGTKPTAEQLESIKGHAMSQLGQDLWVLDKTGYKRGGYFVEFGATDGVLLSNSYLLEKEFSWRGLCIEPNPKLFAELKRNRSCQLSDACIAGVSGKQIDFVLADVYGSIVEYAGGDMHAEKRDAYKKAGQTQRMISTSLDDLLTQQGAPREIDYISVDTEGSEFEILSTFPFKKWHVRLWTIEHNYTQARNQIRELMLSNGYQVEERSFDDWYYLVNR